MLLSERIERRAGGKNTSEQFMTSFDIRLLVRRTGVTIKKKSTSGAVRCKLNSFGITEFGAVISKNNREDFAEQVMTQTGIEGIKAIDNTLGIVMFTKKSEHKITIETECEESLSAAGSDYTVHLDSMKTGMLGNELLIVKKSSANATVTVDLSLRLFAFPRFQGAFSWQINISSGEQSGIK